jgi:hypothetical protein
LVGQLEPDDDVRLGEGVLVDVCYDLGDGVVGVSVYGRAEGDQVLLGVIVGNDQLIIDGVVNCDRHGVQLAFWQEGIER